MIPKRQLGTYATATAAWSGGKLLIQVEGTTPNPGFQVDIEPNLLVRGLKPEYTLTFLRQPGVWIQMVSPYRYSEVFDAPSRPGRILLHHQGGATEVEVQEDVVFLPEPPQVPQEEEEAVGTSNSLSFDEAFADAVAQLRGPVRPHPDQMTQVKVSEVGATLGGIAGFRKLFVKITARYS